MTDVRVDDQGPRIHPLHCAYGCPCQFNALPTEGNWPRDRVVDIDEGHHGDTRLDGLRCGMIVSWPRCIHEAGARVVPIIGRACLDEQRRRCYGS